MNSNLQDLRREYRKKPPARIEREDFKTLYELSKELGRNYLEIRKNWPIFEMKHDFVNLKYEAEEWKEGGSPTLNICDQIEDGLNLLIRLEERMVNLNEEIVEGRFVEYF